VPDITFPPALLAAETAAWTAIQNGQLTPDLAAAVQAGVTALAAETGMARVDVEMAVKRAVRHAEAG
jgi:hypothetical protein